MVKLDLLPFRTKGRSDPLDIADTVNVFFLGPRAAIKEANRRKAQKQFVREFRTFGFRI